jgi:predicted MFS family arabinose efflux permease
VLAAPVVAVIILATCGDHRPLLIVSVLLMGLSAGAEIDFLSFFAARHFGMRSYGRIYGVLFAMFSMGNGLGAPLVGATFDHWGSYTPALWAAAVLFAIGALLFASLGHHPIWTDPTETSAPA